MKLSDLKSKHINKNCVIITCGPSLREFEKDQILKFCSDKIVICVKEAILEYGDITDYFFSNSTRLRDYNLRKYKSINIFQSDLSNKNRFIDQYDIILKEDPGSTPVTKIRGRSIKTKRNKNHQLLRLKNFEKYDISNNQLRPWGPGILYESVFYFCKYIGCKKVYTLGWDLIDIKKHKTIIHYFDNETEPKYNNSERWAPTYFNKKKFHEEMKLVNENIPFMYEYFKNEGMEINVLGKQSYVNKVIPRVLSI